MRVTHTHTATVCFSHSIITTTMISKKSTVILKSSPRRLRTKIRKPKFLSLRLQLNSPENTPPPPSMATSDHHDQKPLINLFPLHPENLVDKQEEEHATMACIFSSCDDDGAATTLTGILSSDEEIDGGDATNNPSPSSVNYADDLVRTAMRRRETERDDHQEKWICYSEVVKKKKVIKSSSLTISSSSSCNDHKGDEFYQFRSERRSKLVLKLDYEKIMKSWVNKGPLYIHKNPDPDFGMDSSQPQTVPDLQDDDFFRPYSAAHLNGYDVWENNNSNGGLWAVPEMVVAGNNEMCKIHDGGAKEEEEAATVGADAVMHQREESVRRYKEKRRNRLFAKTIRYQVRKLNAEKRPRIKGRFVKRN